MKYLVFGIGSDRTSPSTRRFTVDIGITSTKPADESVRKAVVISSAIALLLVSLWLLDTTDVPDFKPTINLTQGY